MAPSAKRIKLDEGAKLPDLPYPFGPGPAVRVDVPEDVVIPPVTDRGRELLRRATSQWQWDAFEYALHVQTYPLATLMKHMLTHSGLMDEFKLRSVHAERRLDRFLVAVDMHYHRPIRNPAEDRVDVKSTQGEEGGDGLRVGYHNVIHACDVLQSTYAYIHLGGLIADQPCPRFRYEMLWAAMVHDFGHPGVDNDFLVKTKSAAAEACEESPLEHYHSRFGKVVKCEFDAFDYATVVDGREPGTGRYVRWDEFVPAMVMDTDMSRHGDVLRRVREPAGASGAGGGWSPPSSDARWKDLVREAKKWSAYCEERRVEDRNRRTEEDPVRIDVGASDDGVDGVNNGVADDLLERVRLLETLVLKAADLGHLARPLAVHKEWVEVLFEEFWRLGDREREAGLDVKPLHDRAGWSPGRVAESQVWFFNAVGLPLFQALAEVLPAARCQLEAVRENCEYWEGRLEVEKAGEKVKEVSTTSGRN